MGCAVSVIIPTYNRAFCIKRAIDSVLNQTLQNIEIIVVDDGSTDTTDEVINSVDDKRLRYVKLDKNGGVSVARNRGIVEAQGKYLCFLDSDDYLTSGYLQVLHKTALGYGADIVCRALRKDATGVRHVPKYYVGPIGSFGICLSKFIIDNKLLFPVGAQWGEDKNFCMLTCALTENIFIVATNEQYKWTRGNYYRLSKQFDIELWEFTFIKFLQDVKSRISAMGFDKVLKLVQTYSARMREDLVYYRKDISKNEIDKIIYTLCSKYGLVKKEKR